jgi:soluble lytic murein transglycosylase-like protein
MSLVARSFGATLVLLLSFAPVLPCSADTLAAAGTTHAYANAIEATNPHLRTRQSRAFADARRARARRDGVDPRLVMAVVTVESHWNARAVSVSGAEGLGQLKPGTARDLGVDPRSAQANLRGTTRYLHRLLAMFAASRQAMREAIAGYNAGPQAVVNAGGVPPRAETRRYVAKVLAALRGFSARLSFAPSIDAVAKELDATQSLNREQAAYWGAR